LGELYRGEDGQILVPVAVPGANPDMSLAMLMERKSDQVYKQTGCRFQFVQRPAEASPRQTFIWMDGGWRAIA
jgi:hypothetical protein